MKSFQMYGAYGSDYFVVACTKLGKIGWKDSGKGYQHVEVQGHEEDVLDFDFDKLYEKLPGWKINELSNAWVSTMVPKGPELTKALVEGLRALGLEGLEVNPEAGPWFGGVVRKAFGQGPFDMEDVSGLKYTVVVATPWARVGLRTDQDHQVVRIEMDDGPMAYAADRGFTPNWEFFKGSGQRPICFTATAFSKEQAEQLLTSAFRAIEAEFDLLNPDLTETRVNPEISGWIMELIKAESRIELRAMLDHARKLAARIKVA